MTWKSGVIWFLLLGLPLVIGGNGQTEIPKVLLFEGLVAICATLAIIKGTLSVRNRWLLVAIWTLSVIHLLAGFTPQGLLGNPFRLQGIFLLWILLLWAAWASQDKKPIPSKLAWAAIVLLTVGSLWLGVDENGRAIGTLGEPNAQAAAGVFIWPFASPWAIVPAGIVAILAGSRSAIVALIIQSLTYFGLARSKYKGRVVIVALALVVASWALPFFEANQIFENRVEVWHTALVAGLDKPFLGWGFGNITVAIQQTAVKLNKPLQHVYVDSSHNLLLDWWVQGGLVGLGLIIVLIGKSLIKFSKNNDKVKLIAFLGVLTVMSFNPASVASLIHLWWLVGLTFV